MYKTGYMLGYITKLSQYLSKPLKEHWVAVKHVLRYLKCTIDHELCYRKCAKGLTLIAYSDADWASSTEDKRSNLLPVIVSV